MSHMDEFVNQGAPGISADRLNEPFHLKSVTYDQPNNRLALVIGRGRARFLDTLVIAAANQNVYIAAPAINTTYYLYLKSDGSFTSNTTGVAPAGCVQLWSVTTGAALADPITKADRRGLIEASGEAAQDNLEAHLADAAAAHVAAAISVTPAGSIAATDVQAALQELAVEKLDATATAADSDKLDGLHASDLSGAKVIPIFSVGHGTGQNREAAWGSNNHQFIPLAQNDWTTYTANFAALPGLLDSRTQRILWNTALAAGRSVYFEVLVVNPIYVALLGSNGTRYGEMFINQSGLTRQRSAALTIPDGIELWAVAYAANINAYPYLWKARLVIL